MDINTLPILGICGASGSGKTTLIEQIIHHLQARGLKVAVAKQSLKAMALDQAGKDSARFFAAGADCLMMGKDGVFIRRQPSAETDLSVELLGLAVRHDLVLVEGYRHTPVTKVWLLGEDDSTPETDARLIAVLPRDQQRPQAMAAIIDDFLARQWLRPKTLGCILIGGKSSRMGRPKHLLIKDGTTWLGRSVATLAEVTDQVVVVGEGEMGSCHAPRLADIPGVSGPLAGILAAMRWDPWATLVVCACDMPDLSVAALQWLLQQRQPGAWAVIPKVGDYHEPLLALYDFRIRPTLEAMARQDIRRVSRLIGADGVRTASPPLVLQSAWRNVNFPEMI